MHQAQFLLTGPKTNGGRHIAGVSIIELVFDEVRPEATLNLQASTIGQKGRRLCSLILSATPARLSPGRREPARRINPARGRCRPRTAGVWGRRNYGAA